MVAAVVAAKHICLSVTRFRDLVGAGTITHAPSGKYNLDKVREEYIGYLQRVAAGRGGVDGEVLSRQRVKLETAKTEKIEFANAVARGDFVRLETIAKRLDALIITLRAIALTIPGSVSDAIATACGGVIDRAVVLSIITDAIHQMLEQMSVAEIISPSTSKRQSTDDPARVV